MNKGKTRVDIKEQKQGGDVLMENKNEKYVTPEYLLSHGFVQYKSVEEGDVHEIPFYDKGDLYFRERDFSRNMFVVVFSSRDFSGHEGYHYSVYVQEDAGCGFVSIPLMWWDLPIEYFESIYYGIRGGKPIADAEFEVIKPKQLTQ